MSQTTQSGGDAAANAVAADLDRIAAESAATNRTTTEKPAMGTAPPPGPALALSDWTARILRVIDNLKRPQDTQPAQLARTLGLQLTEQDTAHIASGPLIDGGTYEAWSNALYRELPGKWTVGLSQSREGKAGCLFPLDTLRRHVVSLGYKATEDVVRRDGSESALYRSAATPEGIVFVVEAEVVRIAGEPACIREITIVANTPEEEA